MGAFFATCWDACRIAIGQAGMNLSQSMAVFALELVTRIGRRFIR